METGNIRSPKTGINAVSFSMNVPAGMRAAISAVSNNAYCNEKAQDVKNEKRTVNTIISLNHNRQAELSGQNVDNHFTLAAIP